MDSLFWTEISNSLSDINEPILIIICISIILGAWLLYFFKRSRSNAFLKILEKTPKRELNTVIKSAGYKYDKLMNLSEKNRLKYLTKQYTFLAYIVTFIGLLLLAIFFISSRISDSNPAELNKNAQALFEEKDFIAAKDLFKIALSNDKQNLDAVIGIAKCELSLNNYKEAKILVEKGLKYYYQNSDNPIYKARLLKYRGIIKKHNSDLKGAASDFDLAKNTIETCTKYECQELKAAILHNLATTSALQGAFQKSLTYIEQAISIDKEFNDDRNLVADYNALSGIYFKMMKIDSAISAIMKARDISKSIEDFENQAYSEWSIARLYDRDLNPEKAELYYNSALKVIERNSISDKRLLSRILGDYGWHLFRIKNKPREAERKILSSLSISVDLEDIQSICTQSFNLFEVKKSTGDSACAEILIVIPRYYVEEVFSGNDKIQVLDQYQIMTQGSVSGRKRLVSLDFEKYIEFLDKCTGFTKYKWEKVLPDDILSPM